MKKVIISTLILFSAQAFSQVIIGDALGTVANKTSVLLEFANTNDKGIVLPYVRTLSPVEGSIVLDATDAAKARVKYYNGNTNPGTNGWVDLSGQDANITTQLSVQPIITEDVVAKAIIGATTSPVDGVLVLESNTKAMVLPTVSDVQNIPSPSPGMMVYINKTGAKRLAVYNGSKWSFWKP
ncbi:hypothetical protein ASG31_10310 [Chryseobacterium sp. Leaf404]|uniref:hypothetical protein n=1 Tax=unclassified Chryseobacterium TaxID=2593645 RepID=UPI0006F7AD53|nr:MULTISPECIES: hypothetical protein [unclassified Chryseobacterium]KQT17135.1 hypothetical protein ASG31_10310 [Chryseobacterium sp. Leaf404]